MTRPAISYPILMRLLRSREWLWWRRSVEGGVGVLGEGSLLAVSFQYIELRDDDKPTISSPCDFLPT